MRILCADEWRDEDFRGLSVAVVADGEAAARVVPHVVASARAVKVFQQEPTWVLPRPVPVVGTLLAKVNLRLSVRDAWTRRLLTPHHRFGRRDLTVSQRYYTALQMPNCKLIAWPVYAVTATGVRSAEGVEHRVDCLVLPTLTRQELAA